MISYSPNMLKTFEQCPQKYWLKYENKIIIPQKASTFETGKKIHALANYYLRGDNIEKLEKTLNSEEQKIWNQLKNNQYFQMDYVNSEYSLSCKVGEYWVGGRLDALVKKEKDYYILDYKTGSIPKNPEYDFQTIVYLICLYKNLKFNEITTQTLSARNDTDNAYCHCEERSDVAISFVYIDLKNNQNHTIELTPEKISEYKNRIIQICDEIKQAKYIENIEHTKKCDFCEYKKICF